MSMVRNVEYRIERVTVMTHFPFQYSLITGAPAYPDEEVVNSPCLHPPQCPLSGAGSGRRARLQPQLPHY